MQRNDAKKFIFYYLIPDLSKIGSSFTIMFGIAPFTIYHLRISQAYPGFETTLAIFS